MLKQKKMVRRSFNGDMGTISPAKPIRAKPVAIETSDMHELRKFKQFSAGKSQISTSPAEEMMGHFIKPSVDVSLMVEKKKKSNDLQKKDDELPYISPEQKVIKAELNHIYTAEPI